MQSGITRFVHIKVMRPKSQNIEKKKNEMGPLGQIFQHQKFLDQKFLDQRVLDQKYVEIFFF